MKPRPQSNSMNAVGQGSRLKPIRRCAWGEPNKFARKRSAISVSLVRQPCFAAEVGPLVRIAPQPWRDPTSAPKYRETTASALTIPFAFLAVSKAELVAARRPREARQNLDATKPMNSFFFWGVESGRAPRKIL